MSFEYLELKSASYLNEDMSVSFDTASIDICVCEDDDSATVTLDRKSVAELAARLEAWLHATRAQ